MTSNIILAQATKITCHVMSCHTVHLWRDRLRQIEPEPGLERLVHEGQAEEVGLGELQRAAHHVEEHATICLFLQA